MSEAQLGYDDARVPMVGFALFLQFKRPEFVTRPRSGSPTWPYANEQHLRWAIDTDGRQHRHLLALESDIVNRVTDGDVLYAAPRFHSQGDLDEAYVDHAVLDRSTLVRPSQLGDGEGVHHHVFVPSTSREFVCSEPREPESLSAEDLSRRVAEAAARRGRKSAPQATVADVERALIDLVSRTGRTRFGPLFDRAMTTMSVGRRIEFLCQMLSCVPVIALTPR